MLKKLRNFYKKRLLPFLVVSLGKGLMRVLLLTCKVEIKGLSSFQTTAASKKCILMFWHNRIVLAPFILTKYASQFKYAAFISNSRDGELISSIVNSYKIGSSIRVPHNSRHEALRTVIKHLKEKDDVVIITPDGPRGPKYQVKQGIALAAIESAALVVPMSWSASKTWELKTWDRMRIPKPFSKICVIFDEPIALREPDLEKAQEQLNKALYALE